MIMSHNKFFYAFSAEAFYFCKTLDKTASVV